MKEANAPNVIDDTIPPTVSHATAEGLVFTSRSKLYAHYKQHGYECDGGAHNVGRDIAPRRKVFVPEAERAQKAEWGMLKVDPEIRAAALEAQRRIKWGMAPLTEKEKERCHREERVYKDYLKRQRA
jgi:hypothetical protein